MNSPINLAAAWAQADAIGRAVAILLLLMSLVSWTVTVVKAIELIRYKRQAKRAADFWHSDDFAAGLDKLGRHGSDPFRQMALEGWDATQHHRHTQKHLHDSLDVSDWVTRCLRNSYDDIAARLQSGLAVLASVGSIAPFVGLFGTVWGIYHALIGIGSSGQQTLDKVAGPVGEALLMTGLGLAVAIPAVLAYNAMVRGNKYVLRKLGSFGHDLHAYFVTGSRVGVSAAGKPTTLANGLNLVKGG